MNEASVVSLSTPALYRCVRWDRTLRSDVRGRHVGSGILPMSMGTSMGGCRGWIHSGPSLACLDLNALTLWANSTSAFSTVAVELACRISATMVECLTARWGEVGGGENVGLVIFGTVSSV